MSRSAGTRSGCPLRRLDTNCHPTPVDERRPDPSADALPNADQAIGFDHVGRSLGRHRIDPLDVDQIGDVLVGRIPRSGPRAAERAAPSPLRSASWSPVRTCCPALAAPKMMSPVAIPGANHEPDTPGCFEPVVQADQRPLALGGRLDCAEGIVVVSERRPKTATIASPMIFSMVPPCASKMVRISSK